jgi:hypothetical protein
VQQSPRNFAFSRHDAPEFCKFIRPHKKEGRGATLKRGRGEDRVRAAPEVSCAKVANRNAHEHTGSAEAVRPSLRDGFTAYLRALPGETRACLSPSLPGRVSCPKNLTPAIGASGPHDFAVRFSHARQSQLWRPSLPAPTSVTMANAPSLGTGWPQYATDLGQESRIISENQKCYHTAFALVWSNPGKPALTMRMPAPAHALPSDGERCG